MNMKVSLRDGSSELNELLSSDFIVAYIRGPRGHMVHILHML